MNGPATTTDEQHVTAADIARIAGVTRAAVSNWRRRHDDFPAPVAGASNSPLYSLGEVRAWLDRQHKVPAVSDEVRLWQALRGGYGEDILRGVADVGALLTGGPPGGLDPQSAALARALAEETSPAEVVAALTDRYLDAARREGSDAISTPRLVRAVTHFVGTTAGTVFDPACGIGSLLLAVGRPDARRLGQELDPGAVRLARLRAEPLFATTEIRVGDSLRDDQWPDLRVELVVCHPATATTDWGREELLIDPRWELGAPPRAESELAWLQHAYAHTAPGGRAAVVMSASAAHRRTGRRIRAELVRRGILTSVVALPPGLAASHAQPVHLWLLRRPESTHDTPAAVRMVDLSGQDPDGPLEPERHQRADVPLIDLLDDTVNLSPGRHAATAVTDHLAEYENARRHLDGLVRELANALPALAEGPGDLGGAQVKIAELAQAGLVDLTGDTPAATSDRLDTDFLAGFLRSADNTRRSTSTSGTFRADARGARIPRLGIDDQRRYGAAFRRLHEVEERAKEFAALAARVAALAHDGLTSGALTPDD